jgi:predicted nucleotidyltransferase
VTGFDPDALLQVLHQHDVRYVLIGGLAAALRGSASPTFDVDITPATGADNLARLSEALKDLDARIRVDVLGVPVRVASLDDIIRSKEAADRDKDRLQLPILRALQRRQHRLDDTPESG